MSAPSTMTCEQVSDLLTELVCGELDAESEANVRAHAAGCATCAPELAAFTRVLRVAESIPLDEPSPAVEQRIMQVAREAVSRKAGGAEAIDATTPLTGFRAWLERLGTWAMSPQVAMASVLLLMVGIGLYALPFGEPNAPEALHLAEEPESESAAPTAAATAAPSEAPAAQEDEASEKSERQAQAREAEGAGPNLDLLERMSSAKPASRAGAKGAPLGAVSADEPKRKAARSRPAELAPAKPQAAAKDQQRFGDDSFGGELDVSNAGKGVGAASGASPGSGGRYAPPPVDRAEAKQAEPMPAAPAPFAEPSASMAEEAPAAVSKETAKRDSAGAPDFGRMLDEGLTAAQSGNHARAVELLEPVVAKAPPALRASARPTLARSLRAQGLCARALPHYAVLTKSTSAPRALLEEAADCYERVGNQAMARELRARLDAPVAAPKAAEPATRK